MKKSLHSDGLREMQFLVNPVQNRGNSVQKVSIRCKLQIMDRASVQLALIIFDIYFSILIC